MLGLPKRLLQVLELFGSEILQILVLQFLFNLVEFLAGYFGVPKRNVRIAAGLRSRQKRVVIEGA